jgi:hypothetical protein
MRDLVFVKFNSKLREKRDNKSKDPIEKGLNDILENGGNEFITGVVLDENVDQDCRRFDPGGGGGVPGPTRKLSLRVPAQMGRREMEHKGEKGNRGSCHPAPRADALAVGGYKRSRERGRACSSARPPARPPSRTRALDLPLIDVRRGSRFTMRGVAIC